MQNSNNFKIERLESQILKIINETLSEEIYDETIKLATFTAVKLTNDNSQVKIYVDTYDRKNIQYVINKLNGARGIFRTALAKNLSIRRVPEIIIVKDESIDQSIKIESILGELKNK